MTPSPGAHGPLRTAAVLCLTLVGCASAEARLFVDVRTDMMPGPDFDTLVVELRDERGLLGDVIRSAESGAVPSHDFTLGRRVADFEDLPPGSYVLEVTARLGNEPRVDVLVPIAITSDRGVTLELSRACVGVACSGPLEACVRGSCTAPACAIGEGDACPPSVDAGMSDGDTFDAGSGDAGQEDARSGDATFHVLADAGSDGGPTPIAAADICTELARVYCVGHVGCCSAPTGFDACRAEVMSECNRLVATTAADGRSAYDPAIAGEVVRAGELLAAECDTDFYDWLLGPDGLGRMFAGTIPLDASCPLLSVVFCSGTLVCRSWSCRPASLAGEQCGLDVHCDYGLYCDSTVGTCAPRLVEGGTCDRARECASALCESGACIDRTVDRVYCPIESVAGL